MAISIIRGEVIRKMSTCIGLLLGIAATAALASPVPIASGSQAFYVDPNQGSDENKGSLSSPFKSLGKALTVVSHRVEKGIRSDKIYLRGGVYKNDSATTVYRLNLQGTPDNYSFISALPCEPNQPGCVQRKSGQWYEKVVIDDAWVIQTPWTRLPERPQLWRTMPGYVHLEWRHKSLWPWTTYNFPITDRDDTPTTTRFTAAPYMLLQDGEPFLWADSLAEITGPGMRTYDHETGTLYVWPFDGKDPNRSQFESWYGGPGKRGRGLFEGKLQYAAIRGIEFRMFTNLFGFHRRKYDREAERVIQRHVRFEDNLCSYGLVHIMLDANSIFMRDDKLIRPRYSDRSDWHVLNNVFYRPSREVFQVHGDNHVFEYNQIIEHGGPWAGPAAIVSAVNTRNTRNAKIRYNYILGQGNNKWHSGSVFMIEIGKGHRDTKGEYIFGGQTFEYNLFANLTRGSAIVLGKGCCRMKNITISHNIFKGNPGDPAIRISSPHTNLKIEHNVFFEQVNPIEVLDGKKGQISFKSMPSSLWIRDNIFMHNLKTIDRKLLTSPKGSVISIDRNLFFENKGPAAGTNVITGNPLFSDPSHFDFRLQPGSAAIVAGPDLGPYDAGGHIPPGTEWWLLRQGRLAVH